MRRTYPATRGGGVCYSYWRMTKDVGGRCSLCRAKLTTEDQYCPNVQFGNPCKCKYGCELRVKMSKIDLNSDVLFGHFESCRRGVHEQWPNDFCSTDGLASAHRVSPLRGSLPGRLQGTEFFLPRSIPLFGFCAAHLSRESARHRNLLARTSVAALSHGLSRRHLAQHPGQRQPAARLAHLRRLCPS